MARIAVLDADALPEGAVVAVTVPGRDPIALYNLGGEFYATDDTCSHGNASLAEGDIEGDEIICPFHEGSFHIPTGTPAAPPCLEPVRSYPVAVVDGKLELELPD